MVVSERSWAISPALRQPTMSCLLASTNRHAYFKSSCKTTLKSSIFARTMFSWSLLSTTKTTASVSWKYVDQLARNLSCPPRSHTWKVMLSCFTSSTLLPMVGCVSTTSPKCNLYRTVVLPALFRPTITILQLVPPPERPRNIRLIQMPMAVCNPSSSPGATTHRHGAVAVSWSRSRRGREAAPHHAPKSAPISPRGRGNGYGP
mmetsp:Transcript_3181/g.7623  ORF Transcript_3181/g.7623 Transcript_3181/m.7623 type:complete len:204 (-) Transcript_3181:7-618(-)